MAHRLLAGTAIAALMLAGTAGTAASAGDHGYRGGYHDNGWNRGHDRHHGDGDDAALLIGGAILGLAVGAALADDHHSAPTTSYGGYGYDSGYYGDPGYGYGYAPPPPSYGYAPPAQSYGYAPPQPAAPSYATAPCSQVRSGRTAAGAVIGGVVGGLLGNGVAASKNRDEGAAVGVALGSVIGGSIGNSSADCNASAGYYQAGYASSTPLYGGRLTETPNYYPGAGASSGYGQDYGYDQGYGGGYAPSPEDQLYGGPSSSDGPVSEDCRNVTRVTTLPDGTEIHEPALACRQANYGSWSIQ